MSLPPIAQAVVQSAVLAATSNLLAQTLTSYRNETPLVIDWVPVFQFVLFAAISTPPNFLWQEFLESTFPAYHAAPTSAAVASASAGDDKALEKSAREGGLVEPRLNVTNTVVKLVLDQTVGAAVNTVMFSTFIHSIKAAMVRPLGAPMSTPDQSVRFLVSGRAFDFGRVDLGEVVEKSRAEFWGLIFAGLRLWPMVSLVNFTLIKSVQGRNLVGGLAGVVWGIYMSLVAAQ